MLAPVFLVAAPGIVGLNDLGAGPIVAILSGAVGFGAAVVLGAAVARAAADGRCRALAYPSPP